MRLALLLTVALLLVAASSASASASGSAHPAQGGDPVCHLMPWLPWCHGDQDECDGHHHHHHHHGDCDEDGGDGGGIGGGGAGGTAGGGGGTGGGGTPGGGTPGGGPGGASGGGVPGGGGTPGAGTPGAGAAPGGGILGAAAADTSAPSFIAKPRLHPRRFRAARGRGASIAVSIGTTITYRLSEPAKVTFTVQKYRALSRVCVRRLAKSSRHRTGPRCRKWISVKGRFAKASLAGPNSVRFTGRLKRRPLKPGGYRLVIRARDAAGNVTRPKRPNFRIVR
jgi:hypothetical protein